MDRPECSRGGASSHPRRTALRRTPPRADRRSRASCGASGVAASDSGGWLAATSLALILIALTELVASADPERRAPRSLRDRARPLGAATARPARHGGSSTQRTSADLGDGRERNPAWAHLPTARARTVLTAVSNGRVLLCTWASRSPPWSVASRVTARSSGSMSDGSLPSA
jgi:hypothetical protein